MLSRKGELGEGQVGCIIGLIILLGCVFVAYKMIPVKIKGAEMKQFVVDEGKSAGLRKGPKDIRERILHRARELEVPLEEKNLKVSRDNSRVRIDVEYTIPVEFPGYTYNWHFEHKVNNPVF